MDVKEPGDCVLCFVSKAQGNETVPLHGYRPPSECSEKEMEIARKWGYRG